MPIVVVLASAAGLVAGGIIAWLFLTARANRPQEDDALEGAGRTAVESAPVILYLADYGLEGRWRYVSPQVESLLGFSPAQWLRDPGLWARRMHPADKEAVEREEEVTWSAGSDRPTAIQYRLKTARGRYLWIEDEAGIVRDEGSKALYWSGTLRDITHRKALNEQLVNQALEDPLTGLANAALFADRARHALARTLRSGGAGLIVVDLDGFKGINERWGRPAGDELLAATARRLVNSVRPGDTVGRTGADEFGVIVEDVVTADAAALVAARIQEALDAPFAVGGTEIGVNASLGGALGSAAHHDVRELMRNARVGVRIAKQRSGGGYELFTSGPDDAGEPEVQPPEPPGKPATQRATHRP